MPSKKSGWTAVTVWPLSGQLDVRSRPAEPPPGGFRWKQNFQLSIDAKLCRRAGHQRFMPDNLFDANGVPLTDPTHGAGVFYHNADHHHQGAAREPITHFFESTRSDGIRRLFDGTQSRYSMLNPSTGYWTDIATGKGAAGTRWQSAELQDNLLFTNNYDPVQYYDLNTAATGNVAGLTALNVTKAKVIVSFVGFVFVMNVVQDGKRKSSRIRWCDLNLPLNWDPSAPDSLAGFQDLDYGDEILAAAPMLGSLYIYTKRSIWRCTVAATGSAFSFIRVYNEPKNQRGCLLYPNTLISTGTEHWYMSREAIYRFDPYVPEPVREPWLYAAAGVIYRKADTMLSGVLCDPPVAGYVPVNNELWFSWPSGSNNINSLTMVAQIDNKTADVVDTGYVAFVNNRRDPVSGLCNENQDFIGVSNRDWSIKSIGGVFYRQFATLKNLTDPTVDLDLNAPPAVYYTEGYNSILRGFIPLGLSDREKLVRKLAIDHDTRQQDTPCRVRCRIGTHSTQVDPNSVDDLCAPLWSEIGNKLLQCPDQITMAKMKEQNLRPWLAMEFPCYVQGAFLYYEIVIENQDGTPGIGGDSCFVRIDFDSRALAKP